MHHCLIKPQTIMVPNAKLEFSFTATRSVLAIKINGLITLIKFTPAGDVVSIVTASKGVEVDIG